MSEGIDAICRALLDAGIEQVFGVPGTQNVALFEGFRRHGIRTVLTTHELAASFMANGYFRATGRPAALATIPGPGFTYALTGLAEARLGSVAILFLVGMPAAAPGRAFQLQSIDQPAIAGPLIKRSFNIGDAGEAARVVREAHALATGGEPGPVMVQLDLRALARGSGDGVHPVAEPGHPPRSTSAVSAVPAAEAGVLDELANLFGRAKRPLFYLGQGALESAANLERVARAVRVPVVTTPSARGIVPEDDPMAMGFDPLRGHVDAVNRLLDRSDLVMALGCKLGHNGSAGFELRFPAASLVHVDAEPSVLNANYEARLAVPARVQAVMRHLESRIAPAEWSPEELSETRALVRRPAGGDPEPLIGAGQPVRPAAFFTALRAALPRDAIVVTDSGRHQILTRQYFDVLSPRGLIAPSDFQSMGFGLPSAIGARLGAENRPVVAIMGDGGFLMAGFELLTARREGVRLAVFVFNDGYLSQIRIQQLREYGHDHAVELVNPSYEAIAEALDVEYLCFDAAQPWQFERVLGASGPMLVEVPVSESLSTLAVPVVARARSMARAALPTGLRAWLKARLRK